MIRVATDRLVDDYLRRLETAAAHLPRARRAELVAEIREHIRAAIGEGDIAGDAAVLNVLERLGPPEVIVDAAEPPAPGPARARWIDVAALFALVLPLLGWFIGSILVLISNAWTRRDKVIGLLLLLLPIVALGMVLTLTASSGMDESPPPGHSGLEVPVGTKEEAPPEGAGLLLLLNVTAGIPSALYLAWRLRPARDTDATRV